MINVHLNGDLVRCPDIKAIQTRVWELKDAKCICKYGVKESECTAWNNSLKNFQNVKQHEQALRCTYAHSLVCPGHRNRTELGKSNKYYNIDNGTYRKIASSAHYLVKESKTKTLFLTLTFPRFKDDKYNNLLLLTESEKTICLNEINKCFSKFVENLRTNYNCGGYVAVREFGKTNHRVHFHLLCSLPFTSFIKLNAAWTSAISDISDFSVNALTTDRKTKFVTNPTRAMRYVCKYFSKCKNQLSRSRLVFISNNILQKPKSIAGESIIDLLKGYKGIYINQTSDYTTCYRITDSKSFDQFCNDFLYPFFELSTDKAQKFYTFPPEPS